MLEVEFMDLVLLHRIKELINHNKIMHKIDFSAVMYGEEDKHLEEIKKHYAIERSR